MKVFLVYSRCSIDANISPPSHSFISPGPKGPGMNYSVSPSLPGQALPSLCASVS